MSTVEEVAAVFEDPMHHDPERARGACMNESARFVALLAEVGIEAERISGFEFVDFEGQPVIMNGHTAVRVGDIVYDWTVRQFWPHDQPVPLVQPLSEWRATWKSVVL